jgi:cell division protein FtsZ
MFSSEKSDKNRTTNDMKKLEERMEKLRKAHEKIKEHKLNQEEEKINIEHLENEPAYIRKKLQLDNRQHSSESKISKFSLSGDEEADGPKLREDNSYLHDNVD